MLLVAYRSFLSIETSCSSVSQIARLPRDDSYSSGDSKLIPFGIAAAREGDREILKPKFRLWYLLVGAPS